MSYVEQNSKLLLEDDTSRLLLEDGTSLVLLEDGVFIRDSFDRGDQANLGTADEGGAWTNDTNTSILSNKARFTLGAAQSGSVRVPRTLADVDAKAMFQCSNFTSFDSEIRMRYDGANQYVRCGYSGTAGGSFFLQHKIAGVTTTIANSTGQGFVSGTNYWMRVQLNGINCQAKWWVDGSGEPTAWLISGTTPVVEAGQLGIDGFANTAVNIDWDSLNVGRIGVNDDNPPYANPMPSLIAQ